MSEIKLFEVGTVVKERTSSTVVLEKQLQTMIEQNMETFFGVRFLKFLGGALSASNPKVNTIFIDDPIGHFDDLNVLSFIDVLRIIISETDWQIIISTHEESFYEIMKVKLNPKYYNSKFLIFKDEGNVEEDVKV